LNKSLLQPVLKAGQTSIEESMSLETANPARLLEPAKKRSLRDQFLNAESITGYLFILPCMIGFGLFYLYPTLRGFFISTTNWNLLRPPDSVGLENYRTMINDPAFWSALKTTVLYVLYNIPFQTTLGLFLAVAMDRLSKSMFVRGALILPYLLSNVIAAMIWVWMLDPLLGMVNAFLAIFGIAHISFLGTTENALGSVALINIWRHMGLTALLFYAGLQGIPKNVYEAATIDGSSEWTTFWKITLPLLRPVTVFVLVTSIVGSFQIFDTVAVATQGGPVDATRVLVYYIYDNAFRFFKMGYATALSMTLFAILIFFSIVQLRLFRADQSDLS
jgi:multiple sugar transport system permease protein